MDKTELLGLLKAKEGFLSGQEICTHFGVSRAAVWKAVEALKEEGYVIDAVRNRGYLLREDGTDVYNEREITRFMQTERIGKNVLFFDSIDSTNLRAKLEAESGAPDGTVVAADFQSAGRGRRGRNWISPAGANIYFSVMLRPDLQPEEAPMLTLLMALAVCRAVREVGAEAGILPAQRPGKIVAEIDDGTAMDTKPLIKWPNDIVIGGKKVCGMLTEMSMEQDYIQNVVIGVGINVRAQQFPDEVKETATSLEAAWNAQGKTMISRSRLLTACCREFEGLYETFLQERSLAFLREEYDACMVNLGREVRVLDPKGEYTGTALGIDEKGQLLVDPGDAGTDSKTKGKAGKPSAGMPEDDENRIRRVYAGEVSVRGVYGYV